jgi:hypothetical protein
MPECDLQGKFSSICIDEFFGTSPREVNSMDQPQRFLRETSWELETLFRDRCGQHQSRPPPSCCRRRARTFVWQVASARDLGPSPRGSCCSTPTRPLVTRPIRGFVPCRRRSISGQPPEGAPPGGNGESSSTEMRVDCILPGQESQYAHMGKRGLYKAYLPLTHRVFDGYVL